MSSAPYVDYFVNCGPNPSHVTLDTSVHATPEQARDAVNRSHHPYWRIVRAQTPQGAARVVERKELVDANYQGAETGM